MTTVTAKAQKLGISRQRFYQKQWVAEGRCQQCGGDREQSGSRVFCMTCLESNRRYMGVKSTGPVMHPVPGLTASRICAIKKAIAKHRRWIEGYKRMLADDRKLKLAAETKPN